MYTVFDTRTFETIAVVEDSATAYAIADSCEHFAVTQ